MFNSKEVKKEMAELSNANTHIAKGTTMLGNIETAGNMRIEGRVVGNVISKSKIVLGDPASVIEGNILSQNAEIYGEVRGLVEVADLLTLKATAVIQGDIVTNKLVIEVGAVFNGTCRMGVPAKEITIGENGTEQPAPAPLLREAVATAE